MVVHYHYHADLGILQWGSECNTMKSWNHYHGDNTIVQYREKKQESGQFPIFKSSIFSCGRFWHTMCTIVPYALADVQHLQLL